jgi:hypothetical protein
MSDNNGKKKSDYLIAITGGVICLLTVAFIILKLCGVIHWSWLWVFSPLWLCVALLFVLLFVMFIAGASKR